ncbi:virulence RhuM family protein [Bifidobacterium panos]|uniref:Toxin Fic n=1 Tax=Bifidobacterium panos TaxID=2675321 RepID=A0ABX1SYX7_9BIFI|nr:virulence RhuM family protein [Bifidobacterium sp. DSM 109963]NMN02372.1 toxin Fic [Bifidobacterium sp. DSM 109963]
MDGQFIMYRSDDGHTQIDVRFEGETLWLSQAQMVQLFDSSKASISEHIRHIFDEGELNPEAVVRKFRTTASDGKNYNVSHYNLDLIIAVGYRVRSTRGTQFRQWATRVLHEYLQKGFALNDELLKNGGVSGYWQELLERIRDIRASEKMLYRQVLDLYATSMDYNPRAEESTKFFSMVQNKLHYAASGHTAAEIVFERADAERPNMGLTNFTGTRVQKKDVAVAKNYLSEDELFTLHRLVSAFFDLAELRASSHEPMFMKDWVAELDKFTAVYGKGVLEGAGSVSHRQAQEKAFAEYERYRRKEDHQLTPVDRAYLETIKSLEHGAALRQRGKLE